MSGLKGTEGILGYLEESPATHFQLLFTCHSYSSLQPQFPYHIEDGDWAAQWSSLEGLVVIPTPWPSPGSLKGPLSGLQASDQGSTTRDDGQSTGIELAHNLGHCSRG